MIKDIIVNLKSDESARDPALDYAISVAETFEAHLSGVAFAFEPVIAPTIMGATPSTFIDMQRAEAEKAAKAASARFEEATRRAGLSADARVEEASVGGAADLFGRMARRFDLAIVGQNDPEKIMAEDLLIEAALFQGGRPVIVVPFIQKTGLALDRVMVCWDGSRTATRAIADAMPLLKRAGNVQVVIIDTKGDRPKSDEIAGADIGQHLARHGLKVEVKRIVSVETGVADTLLSHAADEDMNFMVMGAYGHSRLREFILGGATRGILSSMTLPVLMSH